MSDHVPKTKKADRSQTSQSPLSSVSISGSGNGDKQIVRYRDVGHENTRAHTDNYHGQNEFRNDLPANWSLTAGVATGGGFESDGTTFNLEPPTATGINVPLEQTIAIQKAYGIIINMGPARAYGSQLRRN